MPGVHADVGGGYGTKPILETDRIAKRSFTISAVGPPQAWARNFQRKKAEIEAEARRLGAGLELVEDETGKNAAGEMTSTWWLVKKRTVQPGLSNVYLQLMYEKAKTSGMPLIDIDDRATKHPQRFAIPAELQTLFQADLVTPRDDKTLRQRYIHRSHKDREDADFLEYHAHKKASSGKREIFYNQPEKAIKPQKDKRQGKVEKS